MPRIDDYVRAANDLRPLYIGIDPGTNGGIASIWSSTLVGQNWRLNDAPEEVRYNAMPTKRSEVIGLLDSYKLMTAGRNMRVFCVIEKVWALPGQSATAMWSFGLNYGGLLMALDALHIPFAEVTPQTWMKMYRLPPRTKKESKAKWKGRLRERAQQEFPDLPIWQEKRAVVKQNRISDALLIARYCQKQFPIRR